MSEQPPNDRWKHRRRHAYASGVASLAYPVLTVLTESQALVGIAPYFYTFTGAVVLGYLGFATLDHKWQK